MRARSRLRMPATCAYRLAPVAATPGHQDLLAATAPQALPTWRRRTHLSPKESCRLHGPILQEEPTTEQNTNDSRTSKAVGADGKSWFWTPTLDPSVHPWIPPGYRIQQPSPSEGRSGRRHRQDLKVYAAALDRSRSFAVAPGESRSTVTPQVFATS